MAGSDEGSTEATGRPQSTDRTGAADAPVLRTEGLTKRFGATVAVDDVDVTLPHGELRGLIGPNGAGKSTFLALVAGLLQATTGDVYLDGERVTDLPAHARARRGIALSLQVESLFPSLTAAENVVGALSAGAGLPNPLARYDDPAVVARAHDVLERVGLGDRADRDVGALSHGEQKLLELALAIATDPSLLLLDEPTAGLATEERETVAGLVDDLRADCTVVLIEHDMDLVLRLADRITVLHDGRVLAEGTPDEVAADETVGRVYLGREP